MAADSPIALRVEGPPSKSRGPVWDGWRQFRRNGVAVAGGVFVLLVVILAVVAPWVTPYHYAALNTAQARAKPFTQLHRRRGSPGQMPLGRNAAATGLCPLPRRL